MSLVLNGVGKAFRHRSAQGGIVKVFDNLNLTLPESGVIALLGENGTGKTTLLKCILGLTLADQGEITWCGLSVRHLIGQGLVGYLPENLLFPEMVSLDEYVNDLASLRGIRNLEDTLYPVLLADLFPPGQEKRPLPHLSKGNKKKAAFIQAIFHRPALVVLDEPTDGLDPVSRERMLSYIREIGANGCLVLMSSHQLGDVGQSANQVVVLSHGHVAGHKPLPEVGPDLEAWYRETIRCQEEGRRNE